MSDNRSDRLPSYTINDEDLSEAICTLFSPKFECHIPEELELISIAFQDLAGMYTNSLCPPLVKCLCFDALGIELFIKRFHREAFGLRKFVAWTDMARGGGRLTPDVQNELLEEVTKLGIRINTAAPRAPRVAAAFSLWLATFRPVHIVDPESVGVDTDKAVYFCAGLNFWIASTFLEAWGSVNLGDDAYAAKRLDFVKYEFTYRAVNLSSLESFYASIFTPKKKGA